MEEPKSLAFRFTDPRQQRIYEELKVLGPGPAAFFRDACWIMANPTALHTSAHLVAHLLRELESAIRAVLKPIAEGESPEAVGSSHKECHKEQIKSILAALNIKEDVSEAKAWFELASQLNRLAHRRGLDTPRSVEEIKPLWNKSLDLLAIIVRALREHFLIWIRELDKLLKKSQPTNEDLRRLTHEIPNNLVTRRYFFDRLENPEWVEPLFEKGFFRYPPKPVRNEEEGTIRFPPWPEARYLARMAKHKPDLVAKIIQEMEDTDNAAVISDLVEALLAMPPEVSARLVEKAKRWAEIPYKLVPKRLGQLISHLAKGGKTEEAMAIARVLLDLPESRQQQVPGPDERYRLSPEPQARFDTWEYQEILKKHYPDLVRKTGLPALKLLCDLLEKSIQLSRTREDDREPKDYSNTWRPAVEDHPQNWEHTIRNALVSGVRDAAELVVQSGQETVEKVVRLLEGRRWKIFRRIALHILRVFSNQAKALAAENLTDRSLFEDVDLRHEYALLMREHFPNLTEEDQAKILRWIEEGPEEVTRYREIWQRDWLVRIRPEKLPTEWRDRYKELVQKYGEPEHPEFPVYTEIGRVGPTSPKTADELKALSVKELVKFLKTWKPPKNIFNEPSPEGLGRVLTDFVAEDPRRFAAEAQLFRDLDPTYVRALIEGLENAVRQGKVFDWMPVLDLCNFVISQPREIPDRQMRDMDADPDWGWTRKAIAHLLSAGFEDRQGSIPTQLREKVWTILKPLTDDPDPTPEDEQRYGGPNMDPATLSLNTTRGVAMHAIVRYALWVLRHLEKEPDGQNRLQRGFEKMPEVREVLEAHLDPVREPSLAIRAVYGQWFPWLVLLDYDWANTHVDKIFPKDRKSEAFFEAAWNTYIALCRPYDKVWEVIKPQYHLAVDRIGHRHDDSRWLADPDEKLAEHLMVFYWRGKLPLKDPLFKAFWKRAPNAVRAHAMTFIGQALEHTEKDIPRKVLNRLKQLWKRRLAAAKGAQQTSEFEKEIAAFGWWFVSNKFDTGWALEQLLASLQLVRKVEPAHKVLEMLAKTVITHPVESVRCLKFVAEGDLEAWELYAGRDHVRRILQQGLQNPDTKEEAERIIHYLGSLGFHDFGDLL